jgi:indolepyruvate ferredoxin oxidoreductase
VTGVGGTGVVTVGQLITMAAHLEGKGASVLDFMGFAQKFGTVVSFIRIANDWSSINQVRIEQASADALIGCDIVVSSSPRASSRYRKGHTQALLNTAEMPTADFVRHRDANLRTDDRVTAIRQIVGDDNVSTLDANALAEKILGNTIYANVLLLGAAWQQGLVPVTLDALMRAIELNAVEVEKNKQAFGWGRIAVANPERVQQFTGDAPSKNESLDEIIERRVDFLIDYQNQALADRFVSLVQRARDAAAGNDDLTEAVAKSYFKLLSYKDEYEVARLHTQTGFLESVRQDFGSNAKVRFHLAPPLFNSQRDARGRPRKKEFGAWIIPGFRLLARMRRLRGTPFDLFGMTTERRMERALIAEFEALIESRLPDLNEDNVERLRNDVALYFDIRGYGPVKDQAVEDVHAKLSVRLSAHAAVDN